MSQNLPSHVPPELVRDFSVLNAPGMEPTYGGCPYKAMAHLRDEPRVTYVPEPGHNRPAQWTLNRSEDIRAVLQNPDVFSNKGVAGFSRLLGESWDLLPLEVDPPMHAKYRALLETELTPKKMDALIPAIEAFADDLLDKIKGDKECDFIKSFSQRFPVMVFLKLFGLPDDQLELFAGWAWGLLHGKDTAERVAAAQAIKAHLQAALKEAAHQPADSTLLSKVAYGQIDGRVLNDEEQLGYAFLMFLAGLDTVASSLGFYFRHLAEDQALQKQLREQPQTIPTAIEEFLRLYSTVSSFRLVKQDTEIAGVQIKKDEWVAFSFVSANRDPHDVPDPDTFRMDRGNKPHFTFGAGKHRCMGSHLARTEMAIFIRKFFEAIPQFRIKEGTLPLAHGGGVFGIKEMQLAWD